MSEAAFLGAICDAPDDDTAPLVLNRIVQNSRAPHLSLVGIGEYGTTKAWWVVRDGEAIPVSPDVIPVDEDWWEPDPFADWFW